MNKFGYVYVASLNSAYYKAAVNSAISLRDNYPEANITLFTHEKFIKDSDRKFFNNIVTGIPVHSRAKMWGMARSPYEKTLYLDCDTEIRSENIKNVFDILGDNDIMFTRIIKHVSNTRRIDDDNDLEYHGGVILYNNTPLIKKLMNDWYELYDFQINCDWSNSIFSKYDKRMRPWDQFTIWYLLFRDKKYSKIKHDFFPDGGHAYNYIYLFEENMPENAPYRDLEQIVYHYTIPKDKVNAGYIIDQPGSAVNFN
ncbi:hypothetical protein UFOVP247_110 [uncultured Caudovirales phage]|uniref:Nucleotide-diphospho-sugar transferase n=1 Tax=uncultured Caudovirales phage TaxID=2100421 RepID=A0A6J7WTD1_9CAUD|nr:hypothetical protein UFOVP247_110 [uncultured Caudovirales phage]